MTDTIKNEVAETTAETVKAVKPAAVATAKAAAPKSAVAKKSVAAKKNTVRRVKTERKPRGRKIVNRARSTATPRAAKPAAITKESTMNFDPANWMNLQSFTALPGADRFQTLFAEAGSRGQEVVEKSRKVAEELTELTRANVEAVVEAGKIAATGAKSVGENALQRTREGLEQNVAEFKSLAQAGSPTEFFQLQSEIVRSNFDRMVASFSQLTESTVKLAGEAIQPLSNRTAVNAEKLNELTA